MYRNELTDIDEYDEFEIGLVSNSCHVCRGPTQNVITFINDSPRPDIVLRLLVTCNLVFTSL